MAKSLNTTFSPPITSQNDTLTSQKNKYASHNWEFLLAVLVTAISVSIIIALLAKCQLVRRYLASYRHTRLRETDTVSQSDPSAMDVGFAVHGGHRINPHSVPAVNEEEDDGFIEDNYIPASERARAERAAKNMEVEDSEEEMDDVVFSIA